VTTFYVCLKTEQCKQSAIQRKKHCHHEKPHIANPSHACLHIDCRHGGRCVPATFVVVQEETELP
jgi:hypothetical protein